MSTNEHPHTSRGKRTYASMTDVQLFAIARQKVEDEKYYLDPYLTLETLAGEINVSRNALSAAVNRYAGMIFPVWIANYRIAEVERLAELPENQRANIATLARQAGFANRTNFYRVYRAIRGQAPSQGFRKLILILATLALITACTGTGESPETGFPADGTPIEIGSITVAPTTRVDIIDQPTAWQTGDAIAVTDPGNTNTATYTYSTATGWTQTSADPLYMEDYAPGATFPAQHGTPGNLTDQSTKANYLGATHLAGNLTLGGRTLSGQMTHQKVDLVVTLKEGNGWTGTQFKEAIASFKYLTTTAGTEVTPYQAGNTFRAQLTEGYVPAPGDYLFILPLQGGSTGEAGEGGFLRGTYTLPPGESLTSGQRLTLEITYHKSGELTSGNATVSDFTDAPGLPHLPGIIQPAGYDHAVYNWETLVQALDVVNMSPGNIIQLAHITCPDNQEARTVKNLRSSSLYNGNGYTITGLKAPLFDLVEGYVYNLHLRQSEVTITTGNYCGLLANFNSGTITICSATGTLTTTSEGVTIGGLVGWNQNYITRSYTNCTVTAEGDNITTGGLVGYNHGAIVACAALGTTTNNGNGFTGNLIGENSSAPDVYYSYAAGNGNAIGNGPPINNSGGAFTRTLVIDPADQTGIAGQQRTFDSTHAPWWTGEPDYFIDYNYEGK